VGQIVRQGGEIGIAEAAHRLGHGSLCADARA
jgi:hypothetical protein